MNFVKDSMNSSNLNASLNTIKPLSGMAEREEMINFLNRITTVILYIEMVFCFMLNLTSLSCIIYTKAFTSINMLVINLAIADILYACGIPFYVRQFSESVYVTQSVLGCRISFTLDVTSMIVSIRFKILVNIMTNSHKNIKDNKRSIVAHSTTDVLRK